MLLSPDLFTENQGLCTTRLFETDATLVVADMGFGKTVITLTAIAELLAEGVITRVLVLAPLKVITTAVWQKEICKWAHIHHLNIAAATGTPQQRVNAIRSGIEIVLMNYENLPWFCDHFKDSHGFDGIVFDELTKLKSSGGKGFKKLRHRLKSFVWRVGLSGTPVSEDFEGLYSMALALDSGERLGTRKDKFLTKYFYPTDYEQRNWELLDGSGATLLNAVSDLLYITDNSAYKKTLPPITHHTELVQLPEKARKIYATMKRDAIVGDIAADNAAVVVGKLLQIASGFLYGDDELGIDTQWVHDSKIWALENLIARVNAPVIVAYWFKYDLDVIKYFYPSARVLGGSNDQQTIDDWNAGKIDILLLQPRSAGHGLQLQGGGSNLIWYGPQWSRDLMLQTEARIHRQGQKDPVNIYTIVAEHTIDVEVMERVEGKGGYAELLAAHLG